VLALLAGGLVLWAGDDTTNVDTPPEPAGDDNTVQIVEGAGAQATVTPTAVAGIVSFDITNPTDGYHGVDIRRLQPGATFEEVQAAAAEFVRTGAADDGTLLSEPLLGVSNGPRDHFVTAMPMTAGEYAVFVTTSDTTSAPTPAAGHEVRLLTVAAGDAGAAPEPTIRFDRMDTDYLTGDTTASSGPATIRVDNTAGGPFQLALIELDPDATPHDLDRWEQAAPDPAKKDWSTAPIASMRVFYAGAAQQTITVDLGGGDLHVDARPSFEEGGTFSVVRVAVE
jgi:hypothetical protein